MSARKREFPPARIAAEMNDDFLNVSPPRDPLSPVLLSACNTDLHCSYFTAAHADGRKHDDMEWQKYP